MYVSSVNIRPPRVTHASAPVGARAPSIGSTGDVQLFEDVDVSRANVGVAKRERGGGHSRDASADDP